MKIRSRQRFMIAGSQSELRVSDSVSVPWMVRGAVALAVALALLWVAIGAARAQEIASSAPQRDAIAAAVVKHGLFAAADSKSGSAAVVYDSQGNLHAAYADYLPFAEHPQAVYLFCPATSDCAKGDSWSAVSFLDEVDQVQLAVTPGGRPRLMIRVNSQEQPGARDYHYAECNADCTQPANWSEAMIAREYSTLGDVFTMESPRRNFTLDAAGHPRFVYSDGNYVIEPDHYGIFYLSCDTNCAEHTPEHPTWSEVNIGRVIGYSTEQADLPALALTPDGKPRIVANLYPVNNDPSGIYFFGCDAACEQPASWKRTWLHERGSESDPSWDIEITSSGQPRVAVYEGSQLEGKGEELFYLWCDGNCYATANWKTLNLGLGKENGIGVDLELVNDLPRLLYLSGDGSGVALSECSSGCSGAANWSTRVLDTADEVEAEFPVARPFTCDAGFWDLRAPKLTYSPSGQMAIGFDGSYQARCLYEDPTDPNDTPYYRFHEVRHNVRLVFWSEETGNGGGDGNGGGALALKVYLPFVGR